MRKLFEQITQFARHFSLCYNEFGNGAWRSLVARFNGVEEVVGSNPAAPTRIKGTPPSVRRFVYQPVLDCLLAVGSKQLPFVALQHGEKVRYESGDIHPSGKDQ